MEGGLMFCYFWKIIIASERHILAQLIANHAKKWFLKNEFLGLTSMEGGLMFGYFWKIIVASERHILAHPCTNHAKKWFWAHSFLNMYTWFRSELHKNAHPKISSICIIKHSELIGMSEKKLVTLRLCVIFHDPVTWLSHCAIELPGSANDASGRNKSNGYLRNAYRTRNKEVMWKIRIP